MHVMFKGAGTVKRHNFGYQQKLTGTITCMCVKDMGITLVGSVELPLVV